MDLVTVVHTIMIVVLILYTYFFSRNSRKKQNQVINLDVIEQSVLDALFSTGVYTKDTEKVRHYENLYRNNLDVIPDANGGFWIRWISEPITVTNPVPSHFVKK